MTIAGIFRAILAAIGFRPAEARPIEQTVNPNTKRVHRRRASLARLGLPANYRGSLKEAEDRACNKGETGETFHPVSRPGQERVSPTPPSERIPAAAAGAARAQVDENLNVTEFPRPPPAELTKTAVLLADAVKQTVIEHGSLVPGYWNDAVAVVEAEALLKTHTSAGLTLKVAFDVALKAARLVAARPGRQFKVFRAFVDAMTDALTDALKAAKRTQAVAATAAAK